jgi:hypothetical protein
MRDEILETIPEGMRADVIELPLDKLKAISKHLVAETLQTDKTKNIKTFQKTEEKPKNFSEWSERAKKQGIIS